MKIAKIYLLYSNTKYYIGVTTQKLNKRLSCHRSLYKTRPFKCSSSYVFQSVENPYDVKIEEQAQFIYESNSQCLEIEKKFIEMFKEKYGDDLVNFMRCITHKRNCLTCGAQVNLDHFADHKRTKKHKRNIILFRQNLKQMNKIITKT